MEETLFLENVYLFLTHLELLSETSLYAKRKKNGKKQEMKKSAERRSDKVPKASNINIFFSKGEKSQLFLNEKKTLFY
jgi:hypothetical protein